MRPHPLVEHSAVNRVVVGSSPTWGVRRQRDDAQKSPVNIKVCGLFRGQRESIQLNQIPSPGNRTMKSASLYGSDKDGML